MTKQLLLLRHAKSSWGDPSLADIDRPLSTRGEKAARRIGHHLAEAGLAPDLVLCSPSRRTRDTLELVQQHAGVTLRTVIEPGLYLAEPQAVLRLVRAVEDKVGRLMLVGHDPGLPGLAVALTRGQRDALTERLAAKFPTGALAVLGCDIEKWRGLKPGACRLEAFVVPKEL
ncbi:MAG: histidine phosphatase family protein [Alphaproteobacteria bacterium]